MLENTLATEQTPSDRGRAWQDLRPRLISGTVLAVVAVVLDYAGLVPFALLVTLVALLMSWEWGRVVRGRTLDTAFYIHAAAILVAAVLAAAGYAALSLAAIAIGTIILIPVQFGERARLSAIGVPYVGLPLVALLWLRADAPPFGFFAILFIFLVVWASDTAAFASGRLIGGPKLWPSVSPGKTWAGFAGGLVASAAAGGLFALALTGANPFRLALCGLGLGLVAQAGDLAESALKRVFGVKDASGLIPGHGGFMDRMDSIVAVAVAAAILGLVFNVHAPGHALLMGV